MGMFIGAAVVVLSVGAVAGLLLWLTGSDDDRWWRDVSR